MLSLIKNHCAIASIPISNPPIQKKPRLLRPFSFILFSAPAGPRRLSIGSAAKNGEPEKADIARKKWYQNADEIARFLSSIQPCWSEAKWKEMLYSHLQMTEQEAVLRLQGNYVADIETFNAIESEALQMANYMFCGLIHSRFSRHRPCF